MKMKFFERTYLLMLVLFLLFLNGSIFSLVLYTRHNALEAAEQICLSEQYTVRQAFERDYSAGKFGSDRLLQMTYGVFYQEKEILLSFVDGEGNTYSTVPEGLDHPAEGKMISRMLDGVRYILITERICDGAFLMTYAKDVSYLDRDFNRLTVYFVGASFVASALLATLMYLALRRLYAPLDRLRTVTQSISGGNLNARADESGDDEFSGLAKDFNRMTDRVIAQMEELRATARQKQRMLDDLAHEMRTPLTGIHGYAEYICNANVSEGERIEAAQYIMQESMRLKHVSEILLDEAFIREKTVAVSAVDAGALLEEVRRRHAITAAARGVVLVCKTERVTLSADADLLSVLLSNLVENAVKACHNGGHVEMTAYYENGRAVLAVTDDGIGMAADELAHVTEPFYRVDRSRARREGGTGLGLALCATIATAHGAKLSFSSAPGEGTRVFLHF